MSWRSRARVAGALWTTALGLLCASASADERPAATVRDPVLADELFRRGREELAAGQLDKACNQLRESDRLDPAPGTKLNLADCEERRGRLADALEKFRALADLLAPGDERQTIVQSRIQRLLPRVPRLTIMFDREVPGIRVTRDGVELPAVSLGLPIPANPGEHRVTVATADGETVETVVATEGRETLVHARLPPPRLPWKKIESLGTGAKPLPSPSSRSFVLPGVLIGAGAASLAAGLATGIVTGNAAADFKSNCSGGTCNATGDEAARLGRVTEVVSPISLAFGTALFAVGTWLLFSPSRTGAGGRP